MIPLHCFHSTSLTLTLPTAPLPPPSLQMPTPLSPPPTAPLGNFSAAIQLQGADYMLIVASPLTYDSLISTLQTRAAAAMQVWGVGVAAAMQVGVGAAAAMQVGVGAAAAMRVGVGAAAAMQVGVGVAGVTPIHLLHHLCIWIRCTTQRGHDCPT